MKVEDRLINVTGNLGGEKIGMTIDDGALAHIMSVLTDLYSDPEAAVIREYSTNAYDSHIEAGVNRPIEVTLPSPLSPFFRVRDYGVGLNADGIREVYSRYGASTKRDSNEVVGMLGLGCKSALTYTDQFTVVGYLNGTKTSISVSRDADGAGSMTIVAVERTSEGNGVEIIVPTKAGNQFERKAKDFFRWWNPDDVLINGSKPSAVDGTWIADDIKLIPNGQLASDFVVMGNVAYPVPPAYSLMGNHWRLKIAAYVPIGSVAFTPSREALQLTARTKEMLLHLKKRVTKERNAALEKNIDSAKTSWGAIQEWQRSNTMAYNGNPTWQGKLIPTSFEYPEKKVGENIVTDKFLVVANADRSNYGKYSWDRHSKLSLQTLPQNIIFITGYESDQMTAYKRKKLALWAAQKNITLGCVVFVNTLAPGLSDWIDPSTIYSWSEIDAIKIQRAKTITRLDKKPTGSYNAYVAGVYNDKLVASEIDVSKPLFWQISNRLDTVSRHIIKIEPTSTVVLLERNRINKFCRDFPMAVNVTTHIKKLAELWKKTLQKDQEIALQIDQSFLIGFFARFDASKFIDMDMYNAVQASKLNITILRDEYRIYQNLAGLARLSGWKNPLTNYPLLNANQSISTAFSDHVYDYCNMIFNKTLTKEDS